MSGRERNVNVWGSRLISVLLVLLVIISAVAVVHSAHVNRALMGELQQANGEREEIEIEWTRLLLEESAWSTPGRVERTARKELGMSVPESAEIVVVKQEK